MGKYEGDADKLTGCPTTQLIFFQPKRSEFCELAQASRDLACHTNYPHYDIAQHSANDYNSIILLKVSLVN